MMGKQGQSRTKAMNQKYGRQGAKAKGNKKTRGPAKKKK